MEVNADFGSDMFKCAVTAPLSLHTLTCRAVIRRNGVPSLLRDGVLQQLSGAGAGER